MVKKWEKIGEHVIKVGFRSFVNRVFKLPNGKTDEFTIKNEKDTVNVLALTSSKKIILFQQFRPGPEKIFLELPGGICDSEEPIKEIERELLEETGYSGDIKFVGTNYPCAYSTRIRYNFVATNCKKIQEPKLDDTEFGEVVLMNLKDFKKHLLSGELTDAETGFLGLDYLNLL